MIQKIEKYEEILWATIKLIQLRNGTAGFRKIKNHVSCLGLDSVPLA